MVVKLNLIAAACENMGIGKNNDLPWRLRSEMDYFSRMTTKTSDPKKKNVVIMGRKTWDCLPPKFKPLPGRINFILSRSLTSTIGDDDVYSFPSLEKAIQKLEDNSFKDVYETAWVIGGSHIYKESMHSPWFYRLYLTKIMKHFDCDTFMPPIPENLREVSDPRVPTDVQEEKGIQFVYKVYETSENQ